MTRTQKARDAALFASDLAFVLLAASNPETIHADARKHLTKAFQIYPSLVRRMEELAVLAPNCATAGHEQAQRLHDIAARSAPDAGDSPGMNNNRPTITQAEGI